MTEVAPSPPPTSTPRMVDVGELDRTSFLAEHVLPGIPVLIRGAFADWKALTAWQDPAYLVERAGDRVISATHLESGGQVQVPLATFWRNVFGDGSGDGDEAEELAYVNALVERRGKQGVLGHLEADLGRPPYLDATGCFLTAVFAGRDTRCGLHYHPGSEAFMCQMVGPKRVLLFPPEASPHLDPIAWYSPHVNFSRVVFPRRGGWPDMQRFPKLARTSPLEVTAQPGDMLYIPVYWWHVAFGLGTSICAVMHYPASLRKRFFTRMGLRSNYITGRRIRNGWRRLAGGLKRPGG